MLAPGYRPFSELPGANARHQVANAMSEITNKIYDRIYTAIVEQVLPPGTKLGEESLCDVFAVSRTLVRRVLLQLAKDNIVELVPNRGAFVARPSREEARDVFATRGVLEAEVVGRLAGALGPAEVRRLKQHVALERDAHEGHDRHAAIRLSGAFHLLLAELAGNQVIVRFLRELVSRTSLIIALHEANGISCCPFEEHERLIRVIAGRDAETAARAMRAHLEGIGSRLDLDREPPARVDLRQVLQTPRRAATARPRRASDAAGRLGAARRWHSATAP